MHAHTHTHTHTHTSHTYTHLPHIHIAFSFGHLVSKFHTKTSSSGLIIKALYLKLEQKLKQASLTDCVICVVKTKLIASRTGSHLSENVGQNLVSLFPSSYTAARHASFLWYSILTTFIILYWYHPYLFSLGVLHTHSVDIARHYCTKLQCMFWWV